MFYITIKYLSFQASLLIFLVLLLMSWVLKKTQFNFKIKLIYILTTMTFIFASVFSLDQFLYKNKKKARALTNETIQVFLTTFKEFEKLNHLEKLKTARLNYFEDLTKEWLKVSSDIESISVVNLQTGSKNEVTQVKIEKVISQNDKYKLSENDLSFLKEADLSDPIQQNNFEHITTELDKKWIYKFALLKNVHFNSEQSDDIILVRFHENHYFADLYKNGIIGLILIFLTTFFGNIIFYFYDKISVTAKYSRELADKKALFTATISHELRTPLNGIIGSVQLMKITNMTPEQHMYVNMMNDCGEALLSLINDVLDFSKIESQALKLEKVEFDPQKVIERLLTMLNQQAHNKGVKLFNIKDSKQYLVKSDQTRFFQIIMNLLSNAIKFTEEGKVEVLQKYKIHENQLIQIIEVSDTGIGMDAATLDKLFKPFEQGDQSINRRFGGTGLGLVITKSLVELMGGTIQVKSQPKLGTTFIIELPYTEFTEEKESNTSQTLQPALEIRKEQLKEQTQLIAAENNEQRNLQILICDDVAVNLVVLKRTIEKLGYTVKAFDSGQAVINELQNKNYDLLFLDCQMPELDGFQVAEKIRKDLKNNELKIVAITANTSQKDKDDCYAAGMNDFISKPFSIDQIADCINATIKQKTGKKV